MMVEDVLLPVNVDHSFVSIEYANLDSSTRIHLVPMANNVEAEFAVVAVQAEPYVLGVVAAKDNHVSKEDKHNVKQDLFVWAQ